jgi:purine-binding chemotaxis protein CheW
VSGAGATTAPRPTAGTLFLLVELGTVRLALPADRTEAVVAAVAVTALPGAPAGVEGVVNFHGRLAPVLDLRRRLGLPAREPGPDEHMLFVPIGTRLACLRVDRVRDLVAFDPEEVTPAGSVVPGTLEGSGLIALPDGVLVVHDLERFLSDDEMLHLEALLARATDASDASGAAASAGSGGGEASR